MRRYPGFLTVLALGFALTACGEAPFKAPLPDRELEGAVSTVPAFPTGNWSDDYGTVWAARVSDAAVIAQGLCGPGLALVLRGQIEGSRLDYRIEGADRTVLANGRADLVNVGHAFFDTRFPDGTPNAEGVLHFSHDSPVRGSAGLLSACLASAPPDTDPPPDIADQLKPAPEQELQP